MHVDAICEDPAVLERRLHVDAIAGAICRGASAGDGENHALSSIRKVEW